MKLSLDTMTEQISKQLEQSPNKQSVVAVLKTCLGQQQETLESLSAAFAAGIINQEQFDQELDREKQILIAEMATWQIMAKAEIQHIVNQAFKTLTSSLL